MGSVAGWGQLGTPSPTARGQRTRVRLVTAAREVFERDGFLNARVTDISQLAQVSHGTFYTHFSSKLEIFREVVHEMELDMTPSRAPVQDGDLVGRISWANTEFLRAYRRNAALMATLEQVATMTPELRDLRKQSRQSYIDRTAHAIIRWQQAGLADPELDPRCAASALGNMVDRFAYVWLVLGEPFEEELAIRTLTRLYVQALQLAPTDPPGPRRRRRTT